MSTFQAVNGNKMRTGNTGKGGGGRRMYFSGLNVGVNTVVDMKSVYLLCRPIRVQIFFRRINFT